MHAVSIPESALERGRLMGLAKPIDPSTTAVVVIDFQEFFTSEGQPMGNPHARDAFRHVSLIGQAARGTIAGFGALSYLLALEAAARI